MRIGLRVPPCEPLPDLVDFGIRSEEAGFDVLWIPDSQLLWGDVWAVLGALATGTDRLTLGTNVTNPVTRHPTVTAGASATLARAAPGRFLLGIGVGDSSVRIMGKSPARMEQLRSHIEEVRRLLAGETVEGKRGYRLVEAPTGEVPIYVSATGPKMLQLAGEIADGVIFVGGVDEEALSYARENIEAGAARASRRGSDLDLALGCFCYIGDDVERGRLLMRPYAAVFALRHRHLLGDHGVTPPGPEASLGFYPDLGHARDWDAAIEHTAWVPDPVLDVFCDRYCLIGDGAEVRRRITELEDLGVDNLYVRGVYSYRLPDDILDGFAEHVIGRV